MERDFEVEVVHRARSVYRVRAKDRETAERIAAARWRKGESSDIPGYDWAELAACTAVATPEPDRATMDIEVVYRFLVERERLILHLGGNPFNPSANDAISASQAAADLGWVRSVAEGTSNPDSTRATVALEWLCAAKRVVCFSRVRMRGDERGEIRLYCTPGYLEQLSADVEDGVSQVV